MIIGAKIPKDVQLSALKKAVEEFKNEEKGEKEMDKAIFLGDDTFLLIVKQLNNVLLAFIDLEERKVVSVEISKQKLQKIIEALRDAAEN